MLKVLSVVGNHLAQCVAGFVHSFTYQELVAARKIAGYFKKGMKL